jgi:hypothetical protein
MWIDRVLVFIRNPMIVPDVVFETSANFKRLPEVVSQAVCSERVSLLSSVSTLIFRVSLL